MQNTGSVRNLGSSGQPQVIGSRASPFGHSDWVQIGVSGGQPQVLGSRGSPLGHSDCRHIGILVGCATRVPNMC
jgi:hypothetical protein